MQRELSNHGLLYIVVPCCPLLSSESTSPHIGSSIIGNTEPKEILCRRAAYYAGTRNDECAALLHQNHVSEPLALDRELLEMPEPEMRRLSPLGRAWDFLEGFSGKAGVNA